MYCQTKFGEKKEKVCSCVELGLFIQCGFNLHHPIWDKMSCLNKDGDVRMYYHPDKFPEDSKKRERRRKKKISH